MSPIPHGGSACMASVALLWLPNEDFGTVKKTSKGRFGSTSHTTACYIWAKRDEKRFQNDPSKSFSTFQNLRLGAIKVQLMITNGSHTSHVCDTVCAFR